MSRLLELPEAARAQGITTLEVCHFHLPRHDPPLLSKFRECCSAQGVQLFSLLIDDGDLAHPQYHQRDRSWIEGWIKTAAELGFERVRVIAGKQDPLPQTLARSRDNLAYLISVSAKLGLRVTTENWHRLLSHPEPLLGLLQEFDGQLGLCLDFGNWLGPTRHHDLAQIAHLAESCHAKCWFKDGQPDLEEFRACLEIMRGVGFDGPFTLVQGLESEEWESLSPQQTALKPYI